MWNSWDLISKVMCRMKTMRDSQVGKAIGFGPMIAGSNPALSAKFYERL